MAFNLSFGETLKKLKNKKNVILLIKKIYSELPEKNLFFGDENPLSSRPGSLYTIKTSAKNIKNIKTNFSKFIDEQTLKNVDFNINEIKLRFLTSGKKIAISKQDAISTAQQEKSSLLFFEKVLKNQKIPTKLEIKKIFPAVDNEWYQSFIDQSMILKKWWTGGDGSSFTFNHSNGFMDFISKKVKIFGFSKKDTWNPADVWIIKTNKENEIRKKIELINQLNQLNIYMIELFNNNLCIGISLKKTKGQVSLQECNLTKISKIERIKYLMSEFYVPFAETSSGYFKHGGAIIHLNEKQIAGDIRLFPAKLGFKSNVQIELRAIGAIARLGKIPKAGIKSKLNEYNKEVPTHQQTPMTFEQYKNQRNNIQSIINECHISDLFVNFMIPATKVIEKLDEKYKNNEEEFIVSFLSAKIQALQWGHIFASLNKEKRDKLSTDFVYLAKKEEGNCGPFIKIF